ncbi:hypothetical protein HK102_013369 [Quaeritorhiza haematococci]|nr:hypothetical protein HK102_013369 [Quaeritorhiza haematococci]
MPLALRPTAVKLAPPVSSARVLDFERGEDGKYWFVIEVCPTHTESTQKLSFLADASQYTIRRRFEDFLDFHEQLKLDGNNAESSLPELPKRRMFVTRAVCEERVPMLDAYVKQLLSLSPKTTKSLLFSEFFGLWRHDCSPTDSSSSRWSALANLTTLGRSPSRMSKGRATPDPDQANGEPEETLDEPWLRQVALRRASKLVAPSTSKTSESKPPQLSLPSNSTSDTASFILPPLELPSPDLLPRSGSGPPRKHRTKKSSKHGHRSEKSGKAETKRADSTAPKNHISETVPSPTLARDIMAWYEDEVEKITLETELLSKRRQEQTEVQQAARDFLADIMESAKVDAQAVEAVQVKDDLDQPKVNPSAKPNLQMTPPASPSPPSISPSPPSPVVIPRRSQSHHYTAEDFKVNRSDRPGAQSSPVSPTIPKPLPKATARLNKPSDDDDSPPSPVAIPKLNTNGVNPFANRPAIPPRSSTLRAELLAGLRAQTPSPQQPGGGSNTAGSLRTQRKIDAPATLPRNFGRPTTPTKEAPPLPRTNANTSPPTSPQPEAHEQKTPTTTDLEPVPSFSPRHQRAYSDDSTKASIALSPVGRKPPFVFPMEPLKPPTSSTTADSPAPHTLNTTRLAGPPRSITPDPAKFSAPRDIGGSGPYSADSATAHNMDLRYEGVTSTMPRLGRPAAANLTVQPTRGHLRRRSSVPELSSPTKGSFNGTNGMPFIVDRGDSLPRSRTVNDSRSGGGLLGKPSLTAAPAGAKDESSGGGMTLPRKISVKDIMGGTLFRRQSRKEKEKDEKNETNASAGAKSGEGAEKDKDNQGSVGNSFSSWRNTLRRKRSADAVTGPDTEMKVPMEISGPMLVSQSSQLPPEIEEALAKMRERQAVKENSDGMGTPGGTAGGTLPRAGTLTRAGTRTGGLAGTLPKSTLKGASGTGTLPRAGTLRVRFQEPNPEDIRTVPAMTRTPSNESNTSSASGKRKSVLPGYGVPPVSPTASKLHRAHSLSGITRSEVAAHFLSVKLVVDEDSVVVVKVSRNIPFPTLKEKLAEKLVKRLEMSGGSKDTAMKEARRLIEVMSWQDDEKHFITVADEEDWATCVNECSVGRMVLYLGQGTGVQKLALVRAATPTPAS